MMLCSSKLFFFFIILKCFATGKLFDDIVASLKDYHVMCYRDQQVSETHKSRICNHETCAKLCGPAYWKSAGFRPSEQDPKRTACECVDPSTNCIYAGDMKVYVTDVKLPESGCTAEHCIKGCYEKGRKNSRSYLGHRNAWNAEFSPKGLCTCREKATARSVTEVPKVGLKRRIKKYKIPKRQKFELFCYNDDPNERTYVQGFKRAECTDGICQKSCPGSKYLKGRLTQPTSARRDGMPRTTDGHTPIICECIEPNAICYYPLLRESVHALLPNGVCDSASCKKGCIDFGESQVKATQEDFSSRRKDDICLCLYDGPESRQVDKTVGTHDDGERQSRSVNKKVGTDGDGERQSRSVNKKVGTDDDGERTIKEISRSHETEDSPEKSESEIYESDV